MNLRLREHPRARDELRDAASWYEEEPRLGDEFLDAIDATLTHILEWPLSAPRIPSWDRSPLVRSMGVKLFPYRVIYFVTDTEIVILAYSHQKRYPGYWQNRFGS
ncbi:hypothetical protein GCM10009720_28190 [Yaniella flava]|uniref:Type II toxin-antitoxin system RelE/ParE family toxin n=1 Tax=Yaniella flava TaxID=287930 RepID=A0ABP5GJE6_9MICC